MLELLFSNFPLILFLAAMLIYWIGAFVIIYHLIRFGVGSAPKAMAFVFFIGSVILGLAAAVALL